MADNLSLFPKRRGRAPRRAPGEGTGHVQSLTRGLTLLERLSEERYGISLTDLAQRVGLAPSTTHRLLKSLEKMKFVYQDEERGLWYVGVKAFSVGTAFLRDRDFVSVARRFMRRLMEESGESVNLAVLDAGEVVFLSQVECRQMMRALAPPGGRVGAHCSGVGKALLSVLPDAEIAAILHRRGLPRFTRNTVDTPARLKQDLALARERGYALDDEEQAIGLRCVAAPIHDEYGEPLAAISLSGPKARITDDRIPALGMLVKRVAGEITAALGGRPPEPRARNGKAPGPR
ncbi:MAG TPA: IclR family transcriptional regulator C-terminal domain-containing protein [Alphaproteobacteria bacterium]|nr:IclR family transcriptional regulator C-terminal domain-containing protein [Alphaproteobacteria bacterium]